MTVETAQDTRKNDWLERQSWGEIFNYHDLPAGYLARPGIKRLESILYALEAGVECQGIASLCENHENWCDLFEYSDLPGDFFPPEIDLLEDLLERLIDQEDLLGAIEKLAEAGDYAWDSHIRETFWVN